MHADDVEQLGMPPIAHNTSPIRSPRRKASQPHRSVPCVLSADEKSSMGIVKLDVYAIFRKNPQQLLRARAGQTQPEMSPEASAISISTMSPHSPLPAKPKRRGRPPSTVRLIQAASAGTVARRSTVLPESSLDANGRFIVTWPKSEPLFIPENAEGYDLLTSDELQTCSILRLAPIQYYKVKETLLMHRDTKGFFRKREAQKLCRIDVNKTGKIYDWFVSLGWLLPAPDDIPK